jgi:RNA polymerase sigma-70 factor (ECF subfamily)
MKNPGIVQIWQQVRSGLRSFVVKRVRSDAETDDILQEVFLRIHQKLRDLHDPARLIPWIYQITRHAISDHYRNPARRREVPAGLGDDLEAAGSMGSFQAEERGDTHEHRAELARCLKPMIENLAVEYREALTIVELEGSTQQVGAKRLGLSLSGMKSRVQRGRRQLRQMLDECCRIQLDARRAVTGFSVRKTGCDPCDVDRAPTGTSPRVAGKARSC